MKLKDKGQTSIEYLLMVVVSIGLGMTFLKRMKEYFLSDPNSAFAKSFELQKRSLGAAPYKKFPLVR